MKKYFINISANEDNEHTVHGEDCSFIPDPEKRKSLELHSSCLSAIKKAKKLYPKAVACIYCSGDCYD